MIEEGDTLSARGHVGPPVDAVAYLLDHVRYLDAVVLAQQALINRMLGEVEDGRGDATLNHDMAEAADKLGTALQALVKMKRRWHGVAQASVDQGNQPMASESSP